MDPKSYSYRFKLSYGLEYRKKERIIIIDGSTYAICHWTHCRRRLRFRVKVINVINRFPNRQVWGLRVPRYWTLNSKPRVPKGYCAPYHTTPHPCMSRVTRRDSTHTHTVYRNFGRLTEIRNNSQWWFPFNVPTWLSFNGSDVQRIYLSNHGSHRPLMKKGTKQRSTCQR